MQRSYRSASGPQPSQKAEHRGSRVLARIMRGFSVAGAGRAHHLWARAERSDAGILDSTTSHHRARPETACTWRLQQETHGYVGLGGLRHRFLGIEPSLWVALTVSLAVHTTALFLIASHREPRRMGPISIALYGGAGDGRVLGPGDGRSAGGTGKQGGADEDARAEAPPEPAVPEPAAPERPLRESRPTGRGAQPKALDVEPAESHSRVKSARAAADGSGAALRALARRGEGDGADAPGGATSVVQRNMLESQEGGTPAVASRGGIGAGHGGAGEGGMEGAEESGGTGGGGSDLQASCLACPVPSYPRRARRRGWEGVVDLRLRLDPAGGVSEVGVARSSGFKVLDDAAMAAARRSRFHLRSRDGTSGRVWGRMRYRFEIGGG